MKINKSMSKLRIVFIMIGILMISTSAFSQRYHYSPIEITDIIKGWEDPDYFNAVLMEKGFECHDIYAEQPNWRVPYKTNKPLIHVHIWNANSRTKRLTIKIRKDLIPKYTADFKKAIIEYFPTKEVYVSKGKRTHGGVAKEYEIYALRYTKEGTTISVDCRTIEPFDTNDDAIEEFDFMYDIVKE